MHESLTTQTEVEGFFNLLYYLLCDAAELGSNEFQIPATRILDVVLKDSSDRTQLKYRMYVHIRYHHPL